MTTPLSPPPTPYLVVGDRNGLSFVNRKSRSFDDSWPSISVSGGGVQDLEWSHDRELLFVARQGGDSGLAVLNNITKSVDTGWPVIPGNCVAVSGEVSNNPALGVAYTESPFYSILDIESKEEVSGTWPSIPDTPNDMDHTSWFTHIAHRGGNGLSMFRRWHTGSHQDHSFHTLPSDTPWGYPVGTSVAWAQSIPPFRRYLISMFYLWVIMGVII